MFCWQILGPVVCAIPFRTAKEAITCSNNTVYSMAASVWSEDISLALEVSNLLQAGTVWINSHNTTDACAGAGGSRLSGSGRVGSRRVSVHILFTCYILLSLLDRCVATEDDSTFLLHSSLFSAMCKQLVKAFPVHSTILSSHLFLCLPLLLDPWAVPCKIVFARQFERVTCPYHLSFLFLTIDSRLSYSSIASFILLLTSKFVIWFFYEIPRTWRMWRKRLFSNAPLRFSKSAVRVEVSHA